MSDQALKNDLNMMGAHLNEAYRIYERLTKKMESKPSTKGLSDQQAAHIIAKRNKVYNKKALASTKA